MIYSTEYVDVPVDGGSVRLLVTAPKAEGSIPGNYRLPSHGYAVKVPVFPFNKFKNVDPLLGPEMRSTGESMGMAASAGAALAKAFLAAGVSLPTGGAVLFSVRDKDKPRALGIARVFKLLGFEIMGTPGTADYLRRAGLNCERVAKIGLPAKDNDILSVMRSRKVRLVINTASDASSLKDGRSIRTEALRLRIPLMSTLSGAEMASMAIQELMERGTRTVALQDFIADRVASTSI